MGVSKCMEADFGHGSSFLRFLSIFTPKWHFWVYFCDFCPFSETQLKTFILGSDTIFEGALWMRFIPRVDFDHFWPLKAKFL